MTETYVPLISETGLESMGDDDTPYDVMFGEYGYFSTREEGLEVIEYLKMWKKQHLKKIPHQEKEMLFVKEVWIEREAFGPNPPNIALKLCFSYVEDRP